jgi:catechol 2,3-dioxygenase-like lactoylglutathione lyase family enzyme
MHVGPNIAVTDLVRARRFYEHALGLDGHETPGGWVVGADVPFDLDPDGIPVTDDLRVAWMRDPDGSILTVFQLTDAG